jgi:hypothetical protein
MDTLQLMAHVSVILLTISISGLLLGFVTLDVQLEVGGSEIHIQGNVYNHQQLQTAQLPNDLVIQWVLLDMAIVYNFAQLDIMHLQNK